MSGRERRRVFVVISSEGSLHAVIVAPFPCELHPARLLHRGVMVEYFVRRKLSIRVCAGNHSAKALKERTTLPYPEPPVAFVARTQRQ